MNKSIGSGIWVVLGALALVGCGDGDQLSRSPAPAPGGGLSGGPLSETLTVYALDADSGNPIPSATVRLGAGSAAHRVGQTAPDGKLSVTGMAGEPQFVTVSAPGYASASWGLISASVATIPLEAMDVVPGTADVTVTIPGWEDLPAPPRGKYRTARFAFSRPSGLSALEATEDGPLPECRESGLAAGGCSVKLSIPADTRTVMAVIAEGDDAGTAETSDDVFTMTGIGLATNLELRAWASSSVTVALLDSNLTARATIVQHGPSSDIFQEVVGVPGVTLDHQLLLYPPLGSMSSTFLVPTASGPFANLKLWAVATAGNGTTTDWSRSYERGVAAPLDSSESVTLTTSGFLGLPSVSEHAPARYNPDFQRRFESPRVHDARRSRAERPVVLGTERVRDASGRAQRPPDGRVGRGLRLDARSAIIRVPGCDQHDDAHRLRASRAVMSWF
ncbi:MAG: carboxypeptidase-like regulatory domain-containing protein [Gammaproteobacteria bacterium]